MAPRRSQRIAAKEETKPEEGVPPGTRRGMRKSEDRNQSSAAGSHTKRRKKRGSKKEAQPEVNREEEQQETEQEHITEIGDWSPGVTDVRARTSTLSRIMATLYRIRGEGNDRFRAIHWFRTANFFDEFETPVCTEEEIERLIEYRGIGPATVDVVKEIMLTGYLDYLDDLLVQVQTIVEQRSGPRMETNLERLADLEGEADRLRERNEERRALARQRALERVEESRIPTRETARITNTISRGVQLTGAQRREMIEKQHPSSGKQESETRYTTRQAAKAIAERKTIQGVLASDSCAICLEGYSDEEKLIGFDCLHCFHHPCIVQWLESRMKNHIQPSCPLCRKPIRIE